MNSTFQTALTWLFDVEGEFSNRPDDAGGPTKYGVTQKTWEDWVGYQVTAEDMRALTTGKVEPLYRTRYWNYVHAYALPAGLDYAMFDCAVNPGPPTASIMLQEILGVTADGLIGPVTVAAATNFPTGVRSLVTLLLAKRLLYWRTRPAWATDGRGWSNRHLIVEHNALTLASE